MNKGFPSLFMHVGCLAMNVNIGHQLIKLPPNMYFLIKYFFTCRAVMQHKLQYNDGLSYFQKVMSYTSETSYNLE
jgi:hypothetical protein